MKSLAVSERAEPTIRTGRDHPTTIVLSMHKGASTFISADLAPRMCKEFEGLEHREVGSLINRGSTYRDLALPAKGVFASRVYPDLIGGLLEDPEPDSGRFADKKILVLRRDPRDAIVSLYYSVAYSHSPRNVRRPEQWLRLREQLRADGLGDGLKRLVNRAPIKEFRAIASFVREHPGALVTSYETLVIEPHAWLSEVGAYLGWDKTQRTRIGKRLAKTVRPPYKVRPDRHKRRVLPGNWREVFDDELESVCRDRVGPELEEAGYTW